MLYCYVCYDMDGCLCDLITLNYTNFETKGNIMIVSFYSIALHGTYLFIQLICMCIPSAATLAYEYTAKEAQ